MSSCCSLTAPSFSKNALRGLLIAAALFSARFTVAGDPHSRTYDGGAASPGRLTRLPSVGSASPFAQSRAPYGAVRPASFSADLAVGFGPCPPCDAAPDCKEPPCAIDDDLCRKLKALEKFWSQIDVSGHVRVRHETSWERIGRPTRNRGRLRARLGMTWTPNEEFEAGIRWTTGDRRLVLEPGDRRGSPLSYQDLGDVFDKFELNLDRIFITYSPVWAPGLSVTGGKFKPPVRLNPIFNDPIGDLVLDEAVQPEGIAGWYEWEDLLIFDSVYWTVGETVVLEQGNADEASMFFTQLAASRRLGPWSVEGSVAWYDWHNLNADGSTQISFENNFGNEVVPVGPNPEDVVFASGFSIVNPMLIVTFDDGNPCAGIYPVQFVCEVFHNGRSFDASRDSGYSLGIQYGPALAANQRRRGEWKVYYAWNEAQQESVFTPVGQDDWQRATNFAAIGSGPTTTCATTSSCVSGSSATGQSSPSTPRVRRIWSPVRASRNGADGWT